MPVAFRLSKKFSDRFGEDIADEFVNWFNQVDDTYRTELREWNDRNWQRFDARLEQRLAEVTAELRTEMHAGFAQVRTEMAELHAETKAELAQISAEMAGFKAELIKWMFLFWLGTMATTAAVVRLIV